MEVSLITDALSVATSQGLGFAIRPNFLTSNSQMSLSDSSSDQSSSSTGVRQISSVILTVDAVAPPPVKSNPHRTASRRLLRRRRLVKRRSASGGGDSEDGNEGEDSWFFGGDGPFFGGGGGGFGGGGRGWNFDRFGGHNWDESWSSSSPSDPAFDFVYEVISWIVLSNCVHFAFKKVVRNVAGVIGNAEREKVPMRLTSVC